MAKFIEIPVEDHVSSNGKIALNVEHIVRVYTDLGDNVVIVTVDGEAHTLNVTYQAVMQSLQT
jgi:hypothetical protein